MTSSVTGEEAELHRALGLTDDEFQAIIDVLGRRPNRLELAMYAVMWSEHCSYKSSRLHLRRLPSDGERVLLGPGENAGVVNAGDGIAVAIRIESHNHPSAIEPYQGAATGVGGILRDIFAVGARPLGLFDPLFFGPLTDAHQRWLFEGVVAGISGYGNSVGVPTLGGELTFAPSYGRNPLVNVLCLGALPVERLVLGRASGPGNLAVLLGATTGRDGIGGVSVLASAEIAAGAEGAGDAAKRPSVQVGDPYEEKRLIEACLALLDDDLVVGLQDLGGGGLTCAASETACRGRVGMDVDVSAVPLREAGMADWEIMTSESQERMLAIVTPEQWPAVHEVCDRWEVRATVIGHVTEAVAGPPGEPVGHLRILDGSRGMVLADVSAASLAEEAPAYDRPKAVPRDRGARLSEDPDVEEVRGGTATGGTAAPVREWGEDLLGLVTDPMWVFRQYDHQLFLNTVEGPGGDAALLRLAGPGLPASRRGLAVTTDANPRACAIDPRAGAALVVAEGVLNLACVGAEAVAVVDCLNFGNPEHPEVMWQLSETIDGIADACRGFALAVVGGNVSLYNASDRGDIAPTPVIGTLGFVDELVRRPPGVGWDEGADLVLLGRRGLPGATPHPLAASRWALERAALPGGGLAALDTAAHRRLARLLAGIVTEGLSGRPELLCAVHDVSDGGLGVALAEMALAAGCGARVDALETPGELFTELPSRVVVATREPDEVVARAAAGGVPAVVIGRSGGDRLVIGELVDLAVSDVRAARAAAVEARVDLGSERGG